VKVLITGSRAPVALDLARRFARRGDPVWLADSLNHTLGRYCKYIQSHLYLPRPVTDLQAYRQAIETAVDQHSIDRIIPTCEEIFFQPDAWSHQGLALRSTLDVLHQIHNKFLFSRLVDKINQSEIASPETQLVQSVQELETFAQDAENWVFKPVYSRFASRTLIGPSRSALLSLADPSGIDPWIAQRRIRGTEYSTYAVAHRGKLTAFACYHSIYKAGKGSGIYFVPHADPRIESFVAKLVDSIQYTGQLGLDLIVDRDNLVWILEGNPRSTSGIHLFAHEDDLAAALQDSTSTIIRPTSQRPVALGFAMPIWGLMHAARTGRVGRFASDWFQAKDAIFSWRDLKPTFAVAPALLELLLISIRERRTLAEASTFDIEWNGEPLS
jgi:hypothetical protein